MPIVLPIDSVCDCVYIYIAVSHVYDCDYCATIFNKRKGAWGGNPKAPSPPTGPELWTAGAKTKGWTDEF
jgi:hypothetical protein